MTKIDEVLDKLSKIREDLNSREKSEDKFKNEAIEYFHKTTRLIALIEAIEKNNSKMASAWESHIQNCREQTSHFVQKIEQIPVQTVLIVDDRIDKLKETVDQNRIARIIIYVFFSGSGILISIFKSKELIKWIFG